MIEELEYLLDRFSKVNCMCCFLHVNNLVTKTFVWQFDTPSKPKLSSKNDVDDPDDLNEILNKFAEDINLEKREMCEALLNTDGEDIPDDNNNDRWIDETVALSQAEHDVLEKNLHPVKLILVKVSGQSQYKGLKYSLGSPRFRNWHLKPSI